MPMVSDIKRQVKFLQETDMLHKDSELWKMWHNVKETKQQGILCVLSVWKMQNEDFSEKGDNTVKSEDFFSPLYFAHLRILPI